MMAELDIIWARPTLYLVWAVWAMVVFCLALVVCVNEISLMQAAGVVGFFAVAGSLSALQVKNSGTWLWFELTGSPRDKGIQVFLLNLAHGGITAASAFFAARRPMTMHENEQGDAK